MDDGVPVGVGRVERVDELAVEIGEGLLQQLARIGGAGTTEHGDEGVLVDPIARTVVELEARRLARRPRLRDQEPLVRRSDDLIRSVQKLLTVLRNPKPGA